MPASPVRKVSPVTATCLAAITRPGARTWPFRAEGADDDPFLGARGKGAEIRCVAGTGHDTPLMGHHRPSSIQENREWERASEFAC
jgi:hypothetical protein